MDVNDLPTPPGVYTGRGGASAAIAINFAQYDRQLHRHQYQTRQRRLHFNDLSISLLCIDTATKDTLLCIEIAPKDICCSFYLSVHG